jgi:hypothetical protein
MRDLETIVLRARGPVEEDLVVAERFSRAVGFNRTVIATDLVRHQTAARFKMALHANFELAVAVEPRRIHNRLANRFLGSFPGEGSADMSASRPVTTLAINS